MHAYWLVLAAAAMFMAETSAAISGQLRVVKRLEETLKHLSPSELETYGPLLARRISILQQFGNSSCSSFNSEEERIKCKLFSNATSCNQPVAAFVGGGAGSGKMSLQDDWEMMVNTACGYVLLNPDIIMEETEAWSEMQNAKNRCAAVLLHRTATNMANNFFAEAIAQNLSVVYDGTMSNLDNSTDRFNRAKSAGYRTAMFAVTVDTAVAADRAWTRAENLGTDRYVPLCALVDTHVGYSIHFQTYTQFMPEHKLYDTSTMPGVLIYQNGIERNATLFQQFLAKAKDTEAMVEGRMNTTLLDKYKELNRECHSCSTSSASSSPSPTQPPSSPQSPTQPPSSSPSPTQPPSPSPSTSHSSPGGGSRLTCGAFALIIGLMIVVVL